MKPAFSDLRIEMKKKRNALRNENRKMARFARVKIGIFVAKRPQQIVVKPTFSDL